MPPTRREALALALGGIASTSCATTSRQRTINGLPSVQRLRFTESSDNYLNLPESVAFAQQRDSTLQSAREAWIYRISSGSTRESDKYQAARTSALGVKIDGNYYIAIDDNPDPTKNILLARAQEGYDAHTTQAKWMVSKNDSVIKGMLERAQQTQRIFPALEQALILDMTNISPSGTTEYGSNPITQAVLGNDLTELVATYLREHGRKHGYAWTLSPQQLDQLGVDNEKVEVRRVGIGGIGYGIFDYLGAGDQCDNGGWARGVARNNSIGNGGGY